MLDSISLELENRRRKEDVTAFRGLVAAFNDFLRFHDRLLENLFTIQRSLHPWIESFVSRCGINLLPWHALYDHHFATAYWKAAGLLQDGNAVRQAILKRVVEVRVLVRVPRCGCLMGRRSSCRTREPSS